MTFAQKTLFLTPKACFLQNKTAGRPRTGTQPKVISTRNASRGSMHPEAVFYTVLVKKTKKTKNELRTLYYTRFGPQKWHESNAL